MIDASKNPAVDGPSERHSAPDRHGGVAEVDGSSHRSGPASRPERDGASSRLREGELRTDAPSDGDHLPHRHQQRISDQIKTDELLESFKSGDPATVYEVAQRFTLAYRELQKEVASLRFKVNFGTEICRNCEGLRAGPGVLATCYQVQSCSFTNIRTHSENHLRVLAHLTEKG